MTRGTMSPSRFFIGVDTGGTYTDAAVIEANGHKVIASAKALTTKGDLAIGVAEAISAAIASLPQGLEPRHISLVSVSTTLATNAVVEGHGSPVGVILIGFDAAMAERTGIAQAFPEMPIAMIGGGHDHNGEAVQPLDSAALLAAIAPMQVEAFAIASAFAVRNPAHEIAARAAIASVTAKPVTLSTELTSALDAPRRALTAVLNARLISRITMLIEAVTRAMKELSIDCPLMIVKGDGTLALASKVAARPIETVLSGPAASLVGAAWLSGLSDFILSDMGGTTTDLGIFAQGRPRVSPEGAEVGGWRTMVKASDIRTIGLGGDSEVTFGLDGAMRIGPNRVVPVSLVATRYPEVIAMLQADLTESEGGSLHGRFVLKPFGTKAGPQIELSAREREIMALVGDRPVPVRQVAVSAAAQRVLAGLKRKGLLQTSGFTPSDAAHVLGLQDNWRAEGARLAARLLLRHRDMRPPDEDRLIAFCRDVWSRTVGLSCRVLLETAMGRSLDGDVIAEAVCSGQAKLGLVRAGLSPTLPVVAVGGPVQVFYGEVGRRLGCAVVFPPNFAVANAVGAASGVIAQAVTITIEGDGSGVFRLHGPDGVQVFASARAALVAGSELAEATVRRTIAEMGAHDPQVSIEVEKHLLPDAVDDNGLLEAVIRSEAIGRPTLSEV